jgi:hypothetical protein
MVMVVTGQVLSQLEPSELIFGNHASHHTGRLEHREVSVQRTLGQPIAHLDEFRHG